MDISSYQVNNVLRVYTNQIRKGRLSNLSKNEVTPSPDTVNISANAKKKSIADQLAADIIEKISQYGKDKTLEGTNKDIEKQAFQKLESEYGSRLALSKEEFNDLRFKEIDENGEPTRTLSIEDSKNLMAKLENITQNIIIENMM